MSIWVAIAVFLAAEFLTCCNSTTDGKELVLELYDEFDDFDLSLWKHELTLGGGGNWEFQAYANSRTNSYTQNGILHIHPSLLADILGEDLITGKQGWFRYDYWGSQPADLCTGNAFYGCQREVHGSSNYLNPIVSARIRTAESFSFTYGKVEVRAKLPIGDWLWPAIWLLPTDNQYGGWPLSGEIDIMESRGNSPAYPPGGYDKIGSTLHWGPTQSQNMWSLTHQQESGNFTDEFHTFGLIWNETYIGTYIDSEENTVLSVNTADTSFWERGSFGDQFNPWRDRGNSAPFDRRFYIIINLAVGGVSGFFPDLGVNDTKPWQNDVGNAVNQFYDAKGSWNSSWTQDFQIDSVKVWTYQDPSPPPPPTPTPNPIPLACNSATDGKELALELYDEFDDFDLSLWKHELTLGGGGNWEFQAYTNSRTNSYTQNGILHIHPSLLADILGEDLITGKQGWFRYDYWGSQPADLCTGNAFYGCQREVHGSSNYLNPIVSARIRTAESFSFTYGKVEVRAKLPIGDWLWPAIWLLPTDNQYGGWPLSGEIDIMESRGNSPAYPPGGYDKIGSTLHWGPTQSQNMWSLTHQQASGNFTDDFHTFGLIWNETYIGTYIDSEENTVLSVNTADTSFWERGSFGDQFNPWRDRCNSAPFDRRFYIIINLAVGGVNDYFPDLGVNDTKPWQNNVGNAVNQFYDAKGSWNSSWTQDFQIDSVKVWTYQDPSPTPQSSSSSPSESPLPSTSCEPPPPSTSCEPPPPSTSSNPSQHSTSNEQLPSSSAPNPTPIQNQATLPPSATPSQRRGNGALGTRAGSVLMLICLFATLLATKV